VFCDGAARVRVARPLLTGFAWTSLLADLSLASAVPPLAAAGHGDACDFSRRRWSVVWTAWAWTASSLSPPRR